MDIRPGGIPPPAVGGMTPPPAVSAEGARMTGRVDGAGGGMRGMAGGMAAGGGALGAADVVPPKYLLLKWYMIMEPSSRKSNSLSGDMLPLRQCFLYRRSRQWS